MLTLITLGTFILGALSILCFAAYKIKAREFEFSTAIWRLVSFKITIKSPQDSQLSEQRGAKVTSTVSPSAPATASGQAPARIAP